MSIVSQCIIPLPIVMQLVLDFVLAELASKIAKRLQSSMRLDRRPRKPKIKSPATVFPLVDHIAISARRNDRLCKSDILSLVTDKT